MKEERDCLIELIAILNNLPSSSETIDLATEKLIIDIIDGAHKQEILERAGTESVFEITVKSGVFICLLDRDQKLKSLYRIKE